MHLKQEWEKYGSRAACDTPRLSVRAAKPQTNKFTLSLLSVIVISKKSVVSLHEYTGLLKKQ